VSSRDGQTVSHDAEGTSTRVKNSDAAHTVRDIAQESASIYPDTFGTPPTPDEIAAEAYRIYCERGCEDGRDMDHWLEAERRLSSRLTSQRQSEENR
jgi:hypothetical protein